MNNFNIQNYFPFVPISCNFINNYMINANSNFVIIYIYILNISMQNLILDLEQISNNVNLLSSDILKALKYWKEQNLIDYIINDNIIQVEFFDMNNNNSINNHIDNTNTNCSHNATSNNKVCNFLSDLQDEHIIPNQYQLNTTVHTEATNVLTMPEVSEIKSKDTNNIYKNNENHENKIVVTNINASTDTNTNSNINTASIDSLDIVKTTIIDTNKINIITDNDYSNYDESEMAFFNENKELKRIFAIFEKKMCKTLSASEQRILEDLNRDYGMSTELLCILLTYCRDKGKTNIRYIERIAIDWIENDIDSTEKVDAYLKVTPIAKKIANSFGIIRPPTKDEEAFVKKWLIEYQMPLFLIDKACSKTILKNDVLTVSCFNYADAIIKSWFQSGIKTLEDLEKDDIKFKEQYKTDKKSSNNTNNTNNTNIKNNNKTFKSNNKFLNYNSNAPSEELLNKIKMQNYNI